MKFNFPILAAAGSASAHVFFQQIGINGKFAPRGEYMRLPEYNGPITDVTSPSLSCNGDPNPIKRVSSSVASLSAGDQVTLRWAHGLDTDFNTGLIIDASHKGPVMVYMARVPSATGPAPKDGWFKIYEDGFDPKADVWGVDKLIKNKGSVTVTIPACLPVGDYLLRGELIALHGAATYPGAQIYIECAQIRITKGGTKTPTGTVSFPGAYKPKDMEFQMYWPKPTAYAIPGPRPFAC